ncbi:MAG: fibronectin type III-like domain-contianing protein, partial [Sphingopyxis sp.]
FGSGLSSTKFTIGAPRLSAPSIAAGQPVTVTVDVANSGARAGDEVVQVYVRDSISSVTRPVKELKGFQRVTLKPGETKAVAITLPPAAFQMWNGAMKRVIEPGDFEIMVGPNSAEVQSVKLVVTP